MKIKTEYYGVFYKDGKKWRGPVNGDLLDEQRFECGDVEALAKDVSKTTHKKTRIFKQIWKSV